MSLDQIEIRVGKRHYSIDSSRCVSLAVDMQFGGPQPNHFGAPSAVRRPLESMDFIGDTRLGGPCNVDQITLVPHCNGTHTESIGHIVDAPYPIASVAPLELQLACLVSVPLERLVETGDSYTDAALPDDWVVASKDLEEAIVSNISGESLIIRTLPNDETKRTREYGVANPPPYLTLEAMQVLDKLGIQHLLVDFPSIDRMYDRGKLVNHHHFWQVTEQSRKVSSKSQTARTITEMIFVPDLVHDGRYLLNLQVAPFSLDAAPSRPIIYSLRLLS